MPLAQGVRLGPYEIIATLGSGGMGEVYRARDSRLQRDVAVKVLPTGFSSEPERLRRFELEARAAGALSHPNILAIYDVGTDNGSPYVVSELLEGTTLRERLGVTPLPVRRAIGYAIQIANGLVAAHEKGIVHRDLKPENVFVSKEGRVKILDFGLARITHPEPTPADGTISPSGNLTESGMILGTAGYMSPEQARGEKVDSRSDLFSLGVILYEMLSGRPAFRGASAIETIYAVLNHEPGPLPDIPPLLERVVRHCLEKVPEARYQSARDLAFDLESFTAQAAAQPSTAGSPWSRHVVVWGLVALATLGTGTFLLGERSARPTFPSFQRLTFRRGIISSARFAPDGKSIVYSAAWDGGPPHLYLEWKESPESTPLQLPDGTLFGISRSGELAIGISLLSDSNQWPTIYSGTLASAPLAGGTPREILKGVDYADWSPDGSQLAVVRREGGKSRLEFPPGRVLYETAGSISSPRFSPRGDFIAYLDHPTNGDDRGSVALIDLQGRRRTLSRGWTGAQGLAWSARGDEIWFTAQKAGSANNLYAVTPSGRQRTVLRAPGYVRLLDIARSGEVLLSSDNFRMSLFALPRGETKERDLSYLDWSLLGDLSPDGKTIAFGDFSEGAGPRGAACLRRTDGSPTVRLGDGWGSSVSPDGKWVLSQIPPPDPHLVMLPTSTGESKTLVRGPIETYVSSRWMPDGRRVLFTGSEPGHGTRVYIQSIESGPPRAVTPESLAISDAGTAANLLVSPDGRFDLIGGWRMPCYLYPIDEGEPRLLQGLHPNERPIQWSTDGHRVFLSSDPYAPTCSVVRLDLDTGRRVPWRSITPADRAGLLWFASIAITPDGQSYAYGVARRLSDLHLVDGLK